MMEVEIRILGPGDAQVLERVAPSVFDYDVDARLSAEFLGDARHHLAVALDGGMVVGMASAVHYVHPDKAAELWINEVSVAPTHQQQGVGKRLLRALFDVGQRLGCREAWVLTERSNAPAMRLYASVGGTEGPKDLVMFSFSWSEEAPGETWPRDPVSMKLNR